MGIDGRLLSAVTQIAIEAGDRLLAVYSPGARPSDRDELMKAALRNEEASSAGLREALRVLRPDARWLEEDNETGALPAGEWWVVDTAEVSVTLVRDGVPVLGVFRQPVGDVTCTVRRGHGAFQDGRPLRASGKAGLEVAVVGTGQAEAGQAGTYARIGRSVTALLREAFLVRVTVPSTFPMLQVADGHIDAFWQYEPVLPGVALGILAVAEAGGVVTAADGSPWTPAADSVLVAAPGVHAEMVRVLGEAG